MFSNLRAGKMCFLFVIQFYDCANTPNGNLTLDCSGVCDGSAQEDLCGVCNGDDSSCTGCMNQDACNYNSDVIEKIEG